MNQRQVPKRSKAQDQSLKPAIKGSGQAAGKTMLRRLESLEEELASSLSYTGNARWMIPYADLLTILLGLFLVMLSLSTMDNQRVNDYANRVNEKLDMKNQIVATQHHELTQLKQRLETLKNMSVAPVELLDSEGGFSGEAEALSTLAVDETGSAENGEIADTLIDEQIQISQQERGLVITILDSVLFESGSADLSPRSKRTLSELGRILKTESHPIRVEGHTDNTPIATSQYPTNWELSTARATNIVRFLVETHGFDPARLSAAGYGEYHPVGENSSVKGKQKNRRVDIVVLNNRTAQSEPPASEDSGTLQ